MTRRFAFHRFASFSVGFQLLADRKWIILLEPTFGPTPDFNATFDPGTGRALILDEGDFCMFDVRTNTWTAAPQPGAIGPLTDFVYDVDSDRAIAFAGGNPNNDNPSPCRRGADAPPRPMSLL